jgi:hypothetical protein
MNTQGATDPGQDGNPQKRRFRLWRLAGWVGAGAVCAGLAAGVTWLVQRSARPEALEYTPAGGQAEAQVLALRVLATNRPWLEPQAVRATYSFKRKAIHWSLSSVFREHSLSQLRTFENKLTEPVTARWKSPADLRVGASFRTPLAAMLSAPSNYTVHSVGTARWSGKTVVAVDVMFQTPVTVHVGMGAGDTHYSSAGFRAGSARILIEPLKALPLFIGTSDSSAIGLNPRFNSTFTFDPDFFEMPGGRAPRFVEWRMPGQSWRSWYEFQVTNSFWLFKRGKALIKIDRWSFLDHRIEMTGLRAEPVRPGDLLQEYPTALTGGDPSPGHTRAWSFGREDVFRVSRFDLAIGRELRIESGPADLGIGHCAEGAVWAVLIPRDDASLNTRVAGQAERPDHVWLRFHPREIARLFPQATISADGAEKLKDEMCAIANMKMLSSWSAEGGATIPGPGQMTVDVDTKEGPRRFFAVDTRAGTARYAAEFEGRALNLSAEAIELMAQPPPDHRQEIAKETGDKSRPRVVSVHPPPGALAVPPMTELRVRFDRPMDPFAVKLDWESGEYLSTEYPRYDSNTFEFAISVRLAPGVLHQIVVGIREPGFGQGFVSTQGNTPALHVWRFATGKPPAAPAAAARAPASPVLDGSASRAAPGSNDMTLITLLKTMQRRRAQMTSLVEHVQTTMPSHRSLCFASATFKWQHPGQYYGDVSQIMGGLFRIGCDGQNWWWETGSAQIPDLVLCPTNAMRFPDISIADPFGLAADPPAKAAQCMGLVYAGMTNISGADCYLVESRAGGPGVSPSQWWWINAETYLVAESEAAGMRTRFVYEPLNRPLPSTAFAPARAPDVKPARLEALDADYTNRFLNLRDGNDGRMSVRWGKIGPKGMSSDGLN